MLVYDERNESRSTDQKRFEKKSRSRDLRDTLLTYLVLLHFWFVCQAVSPHTEFEVSSYTHSRDMEGIPKFKK